MGKRDGTLYSCLRYQVNLYISSTILSTPTPLSTITIQYHRYTIRVGPSVHFQHMCMDGFISAHPVSAGLSVLDTGVCGARERMWFIPRVADSAQPVTINMYTLYMLSVVNEHMEP